MNVFAAAIVTVDDAGAVKCNASVPEIAYVIDCDPSTVPVTVHVCAPVPVNDRLVGLNTSPVPLGVIVTVAAAEMSTLKLVLVTPLPNVGYVGNVTVLAA